MRKYPADAWLRLGQWIHDERLRAGHTNTPEWAALVGRSPRSLLGLERGEPVGTGTIEAVAKALDIPGAVLFSLLAGEPTLSLDDERKSVGGDTEGGEEFEFLTRVREDLTTEEMDTLMEELNPYLERLVRDIKRRRD